MRLLTLAACAAGFACAALVACSSDSSPGDEPLATAVCTNEFTEAYRFDTTSTTPSGPDGSVDPFGAKAAGQARAGRLRDASQIIQGPRAGHKARVGDFALANSRIALYIEAENRANGYTPFGGEILSIEPVGDDGKPKGVSDYNETLITLSRQTIKPDKVVVLADGSDGKAAIIRASGVLANIPFLDTFRAISQEEYGFPVAIDYVLEPNAENVLIRLSVANTTEESIDFSPRQFLGFFHTSRNEMFSEATGFAKPSGEQPWIAFEGSESGFLFKGVGQNIRTELEISGFQLFSMRGLVVDSCAAKTTDYVELTTGAGNIDGTLEAKRRAYGEPAWREVRGVIRETGGTTIGGATVHATTPDGKYLTRVRAGDDGSFVIHVPQGPAQLIATVTGWAIPPATPAPAGTATVDITLPQRATLDITVQDPITLEPLPSRVQVIPETPIAHAPESFGLREMPEGRLWQYFAMNGRAVLPVPPGQHRVIASRGYEYELFDAPAVTATAGTTTTLTAPLAHSVDSTGIMCADFHIHSHYSPDSSDPVDGKLMAAVADGLDIPVSSEHEWIIDFSPIIQRLGVTKWAFSLPSSELTTWTWGHFGVVPLLPKPDQPNNGAVPWIGETPPTFFHEVATLPEKPAFIVNHPSDGTQFFAYFVAAQFDRSKASGDPSIWSDEFTALEVFNDSDFDESRASSVGDWFALLNADKRRWAVGNSDTHDQRTKFAGYPRTCFPFGHDDPTKLTAVTVADAIKNGSGIVSGGLSMTVKGPGGVGPGGSGAAGAYNVVVQSASWITGGNLEVIVDGVTTQTLDLPASTGPGPGKRHELTVNVTPQQSKPTHWVIFHARGTGDLAPLHPKRKPFAVSNPIFF